MDILDSWLRCWPRGLCRPVCPTVMSNLSTDGHVGHQAGEGCCCVLARTGMLKGDLTTPTPRRYLILKPQQLLRAQHLPASRKNRLSLIQGSGFVCLARDSGKSFDPEPACPICTARKLGDLISSAVAKPGS